MDEASSLSVVCSSKTKSNGLELLCRELHTNMQNKNIFTVRVTEHQNRLPSEAVESPMQTSKPHMNMYLCDLLQATCFSGGVGVGLDDLFKSLPTPAILCNSVLPLAGSHATLEVHLCQMCTLGSNSAQPNPSSHVCFMTRRQIQTLNVSSRFQTFFPVMLTYFTLTCCTAFISLLPIVPVKHRSTFTNSQG